MLDATTLLYDVGNHESTEVGMSEVEALVEAGMSDRLSSSVTKSRALR